jgi:hypothetical protein
VVFAGVAVGGLVRALQVFRIAIARAAAASPEHVPVAVAEVSKVVFTCAICFGTFAFERAAADAFANSGFAVSVHVATCASGLQLVATSANVSVAPAGAAVAAGGAFKSNAVAAAVFYDHGVTLQINTHSDANRVFIETGLRTART